MIATRFDQRLAAYFIQEVSQPELTWANLKTIAVLFWQLVLIGVLLFDVRWCRYLFFTLDPATIPVVEFQMKLNC